MIQSKEGLLCKPQQPKGPIDIDDEPSGPYIPISECYTGKPVSLKGYPNNNHHNNHHYHHPPPPSSSIGYHHPSIPPPLPHPSHHHKTYANSNNNNNNHSIGYHHQSSQLSHQTTKPEESANYDIPRTSVFTKVALPTNKPSNNSSLSNAFGRLPFVNKSATLRPTSKTSNNGTSNGLIIGPSASQTINRTNNLFHLDNSLIPSRNRASIRSCGPTMENSSATNGGGKHSPTGYANDDSVSPNDFSYYNFKSNGLRIPEPPPRPPKPTKLNSRNKSESCSSLPGTNLLGDQHVTSPPPTTVSTAIKSNPFESHLDSPYFPPPVSINNQPLSLDDVYDFPKSEPVFTSMRTTIPAPGSRGIKGNSHSYTNAPPGHLSKPPVFTYDYKGTLPNCLDDNHITFESETCDRSPLTPNSAFDSLSSNGSLSKSLTPPAVNRDLKPRRKGSDSDTNSSPTSPTFTLSPPPAHSKHHQSISKPRHLNETPPRVPSRGRQFQFHHSKDASNSDEDVGIFHKRNSSSDDQSRRAFTIPRKSPNDSDGVTYLDLDLQESSDKDCSRSRSINSTDHHHLHKSSVNHSKESKSNLSGSQSTVYKSIDFVATDAFKQLRISSHRSAQ